MNWWVRSTEKFVLHSIILNTYLFQFLWYLISASASFIGIPTGITSCAIRLKICAVTAGIKKY